MAADAGYSGGCQCGAVRYAVRGPLTDLGLCHCRSCQKAHAAPAVTWGTLETSELVWTRGEPAQFQSSPQAVRSFCAHCGTPLTYRLVEETTIDLALATLDDPAAVAPKRNTGTEGEMPWFATAHTLPRQTMPPLGRTFQHPDHDTDTWPQPE